MRVASGTCKSRVSSMPYHLSRLGWAHSDRSLDRLENRTKNSGPGLRSEIEAMSSSKNSI
jgi:hypothetical protein